MSKRIQNTKIAIVFGISVAFGGAFESADAAQSVASRPDNPPIEAAHHHAGAVRVYVMNGLFGELVTNGMAEIGQKLRARGAIVQVGSWTQESAFVADACAHRGDRIVFIGHSLGAVAAAGAVRNAKACGASRVSMVGIDPPAMGSAVPNNTHAVNFVGTFNSPITGARNVPVSGHGHVSIVSDPTMQNRIVEAALR